MIRTMEMGSNLSEISQRVQASLTTRYTPQSKREYCNNFALSGQFHLEVVDKSYGESYYADIEEVGESSINDPSTGLLQNVLVFAL